MSAVTEGVRAEFKRLNDEISELREVVITAERVYKILLPQPFINRKSKKELKEELEKIKKLLI